MDNTGIKLHANFYVMIICRMVFYWSLFIFSCCTMFLFCVRSMCVWWKKWSGIGVSKFEMSKRSNYSSCYVHAIYIIAIFSIESHYTLVYAPGKELEQVTFKMNNFHLRRDHLRRDIYLKLDTFLTESENILNDYIFMY